jgi:hypothetical protein
MAFIFQYKVSGPLHVNPTAASRKAVETAISNTATFGQALIRRASRVDTGRMRRGFHIQAKRWDEYLINNTVPYTPVWVGRDGLMVNQVPAIQSELDQQLKIQLKKFMN